MLPKDLLVHLEKADSKRVDEMLNFKEESGGIFFTGNSNLSTLQQVAFQDIQRYANQSQQLGGIFGWNR